MAREYPTGRRIAPSILSADFGCLADQVKLVMDAGARVIHVDVMDGHFVPPITIGPLIVEGIRDQVHDQDGFIDVHLMIERPERHVEAFAKAGADSITIHYEATPHVHYTIKSIKDLGLRAGVAINPATPAEAVLALDGIVDLALCMTVNPGWGGQSYIPRSEWKVTKLRQLLPEAVVEVDGGVDPTTAPLCTEAGAQLLVAGSYVFGAADPAAAYAELVAAAQAS
jgi:ribulose-phosphate 3-epimerase